MFGALWSEHCGYKNSKPLLRLFPTEGAHVLTKAGEENAGAVDIGDGLCVAFKIESHNHPSAIEPYQGAATGVGGIVRDIFAMGARPIAILDSLRFGPLQPSKPPLDDRHRRERAAETRGARNRRRSTASSPASAATATASASRRSAARSRSRRRTPATRSSTRCASAWRASTTCVRARADGVGNLLMLVGADTGRDGIHGATFASVELDETLGGAAAGRAGRQPVPREAADGGVPRADGASTATGSSGCRTSARPA